MVEVDRDRPVLRLEWELQPDQRPVSPEEVRHLRVGVTGRFGSVFSFSGRWRYTGSGRITEGLTAGDTAGTLVVELDELPDDGERDLVIYLTSGVSSSVAVSNLLRLRVRITNDDSL